MSRWTHRHALRAARRPSSAHVSEMVRPSPARAEPHDETSWLPLPEPEGLPSLDDLLVPDADRVAPREVPPAQPSPARAEPHDETSWLPLPEIEDLPDITELLSPDTNLDVPAVRQLPLALPSPARAEPHDETSWLPLPEIEDLPDITELVDPDRATTTPPPSSTRRRPALAGVGPRRALAVALVTALLAGAVYVFPKVFNNGDHVQIRVDGRLVSAQSGQNTVGSLLKEQKIKLGPDDQVSPARSSSLSDGMTVRVLRAVPITVDLDGAARVVYTAFSLPRDFVASLHLPANVSLRNPPTKIQAGATLQLRTHRKGTLALDGQGVNYDLPVLTVRELLANYNVVMGPQDHTDPPIDSVIPVDNPFVTVVRVATNIQVVPTPYQTPDQTLPDPNLDVGQTRVQPGTGGIMNIAYAVTMNNGAESGRAPVSQVPAVVAQPTIHYFGTRADPRWDNIARCETGGNWAMQGPEFSGGVGFYNGTWNSFGGQQFASNAGQATREQQIIVAERVRKQYGFGAWGCGKKLGYG